VSPATDLDIAAERAAALLQVPEASTLGEVTARDSAEFARAAGESDPRLTDSECDAFIVHPMYIVSLLGGAPGRVGEDLRPDGMFRFEVPGTDGLAVRLMAGGQDVSFHLPCLPGDYVDVSRTLISVEMKAGRSGRFLLMTVAKTYTARGRGVLATLTERFIVR
jgi:acyl dehydratase